VYLCEPGCVDTRGPYASQTLVCTGTRCIFDQPHSIDLNVPKPLDTAGFVGMHWPNSHEIKHRVSGGGKDAWKSVRIFQNIESAVYLETPVLPHVYTHAPVLSLYQGAVRRDGGRQDRPSPADILR
jgi:hypothetical protein